MKFLKLISLTALFSVNMTAADVFVDHNKLKMTGVISSDEFSKFKTNFESVLTRDDMGLNELNSLHLENVQGGSVTEAIKIADFVRRMRLQVYLSGECLSACVLIYFASVERKYAIGAKLGVHRIRFAGNGLKDMSLDEATQNYKAGEELLISKLNEYGASQSIIEKLKGTSSRDITLIPISEVPVYPAVVSEWLQDSCDGLSLNHLNVGHLAFRALEDAISKGSVPRDTPTMTQAQMIEMFGQKVDPTFTFASFGKAEMCVSRKLMSEYLAKKNSYCKDNGLTCGSLFKKK